ncbi:MAG: HD domain-containing protein [Planctomycetia bacterium]|nr:HD domain-containing protein [Planctomycetia bacterium]
MSDAWPKIIRDPVHNIIPFVGDECDKLLLRLINTKEFQRLRRIKQLGLSQLVFPGADHSRFAHSIGVMHLARRMLDRVSLLGPDRVNQQQRAIVLAAALLHDIGHGPFSHAFEKITGDRHEKRTLEIITTEGTEVNSVLTDFDPELPSHLKVFFDEDLEEDVRGGAVVPPHLTQIVSSQLDADRFDYLLRDSYATGAEYGRFDVEWMLQHIDVDGNKGRFFLHGKALLAAETYVFARYHMYRSVYYHKTTRAAEVMLRLLFRRYKELLDQAENDSARRAIVPNAPPAVQRAFSTEIALEEYLLLDDHSLTEFAKACTICEDRVLSELAAGLLHRRLFKAIDVTSNVAPGVVGFCEKAKELIAAAGFKVEYAFAHDTPSDTAYKLYNPDAEKPATQIYIESSAGKYVELSACSESVKQLAEKYTLVRYYFPDAVRKQVVAEAVPLLNKV